MKKRMIFYGMIAVMVILDSVLLRSPNLLGKIGLVIYKYHYLRTFPKTLLTVTIVVACAALIAELIRWLVRLGSMKRAIGVACFAFLLLAAAAILVKTGIDFTAWTYSHTGRRFRYGAYLLPIILMMVFGYHLLTLPKRHLPFPESPPMNEGQQTAGSAEKPDPEVTP
ncbi:MAG TPA: hypothetical protein VD816_11520 [Ohtaekwangia sp.]|nr:hypothetical protein [Ohtaekwangia sp.]